MKLANIVSKVLDKVRIIPAQISIAFVSGILMYAVNYSFKDSATDFSLKASLSELNAFPLDMPNVKYDLLLDTMEVRTTLIKPNEFLVDILKKYELNDNQITSMISKVSKVFDIKKLRAGREYSVMCKKMTEMPYYLIYEPDAYGYIKLDFRDTMRATYIPKNIQTNIKLAKGTVNNTLSESMAESGLSYDLIDKMEDALGYTVDFYHVQKNDKFRVLYDDHSIDGKTVGVGKMYGAYFEQNGKDYYAIYFKKGDREGYYDLEGRPMKQYFLKAPVKFSRISSGFSLRRFHPVLKYNRPHFGTDYAAPAGTPIMSVGNGVVVEASRNAYNGIYVKIKHDATYTTQYLHMSRIARGISKGARVSQGQTIGYVGSTGLATGPHVCFRFWKNGVQCNHLKEKVTNNNPVMNKADLPEFFKVRDEVVKKLNVIKNNQTTQAAQPVADGEHP